VFCKKNVFFFLRRKGGIKSVQNPFFLVKNNFLQKINLRMKEKSASVIIVRVVISRVCCSIKEKQNVKMLKGPLPKTLHPAAGFAFKAHFFCEKQLPPKNKFEDEGEGTLRDHCARCNLQSFLILF
jgi:hypothetical protein